MHERSDLYPEPDQFRPDRFLERTFGSHEFIPFGGGSRRCIGAALALYELKLILTVLFKGAQFRLTTASDRPNQPRRRGFTLGPSIPVQLEVVSKQR